MMITLVITLSVSILWTSGLIDGNDVTQKPSIKFEQKGLSAQINCSHNKGAAYFQMYWYRQLPGQGMKQVVYSTTSKPEYYGDFTEDKYSTNKTVAESGSFTVKKLEAGDSGMYFCAVSQHSDTDDE
ncbi:hypothetical protein UPYG_G00227750 [Umbra pygmaea]|uniref:Ig-like domain-containing protein n=1 Tax=Umbra pygmaea TaxID=75934 RepID=A0ABD0WCT6_UMBPY